MTITLTNVPTGESQTILQVRNYAASVTVPTVVHRIIGSGVPDFTIKPATPREGTFNFLCLNETTCMALARFLEAAGPFALADTVTAIANTTFVVTGEIRQEVDEQTFIRCLLSVEYTETT